MAENLNAYRKTGFPFWHYIDAEKQIITTNNQYRSSLLLAEELRQTSDDLTRMVRTYVATGNTIYKQHFQEIFDIRDGKSPRPTGLNKVYWDLVLENDKRPSKSGEAISLLELMRQAGFTDEEFNKLKEAKLISDTLTKTEFFAMQMIEDKPTDQSRLLATRMLFDTAYHGTKAKIMKAIDEFHDMVDYRSINNIHSAEKLTENIRVFIIIFSIMTISLFWKLFSELKKLAKHLSENLKQRTHDLEHSEKISKEMRITKRLAEEANAEKSRFLANMSHELRTPMHAILSFSYLGMKKIDSGPKEKLFSYFSKIDESAHRLMTLINDLLDLSKLESGKMVFSFEENSLEKAVLVVVDELKYLAKEKRVQIIINPISDNVTGFFDWDKILQVIRNLLSNAIKFTPEQKKITISPSLSESSFLKLTVSDQGVGIPHNELEDVFDPFVQSSKTITKSGGTGLGLPISKEIIMEHNGNISASNNEKNGVSFTFVIPVSQDNQL